MSRNSKSYKRSQTSAIIGMTLVLLLIGIFGLILVHTQALVTQVKESIVFTLELHDGASSEEVNSLKQELKNSDFVKKETVRYVSREDAAALLKEDFGDIKAVLDSNILANSLQFNLKADYMTAEKLGSGQPGDDQGILGKWEGLSYVKGIFYQDIVVENVAQNLRKLGWAALFLGVLFLVVAVLLLDNMVRLLMYSHRFLLRNMKLVGATHDFITRPYLRSAVINGIISSVIAIALLSILLFTIRSADIEFAALSMGWRVAITFAGVLVLGIIISLVSTWFAVKRYLSMPLDNLY